MVKRKAKTVGQSDGRTVGQSDMVHSILKEAGCQGGQNLIYSIMAKNKKPRPGPKPGCE